MLQVLDQLRNLYEAETKKCHHTPISRPDPSQKIFTEFLAYPTWDYVCWLESHLLKSNSDILDNISSSKTITTTVVSDTEKDYLFT